MRQKIKMVKLGDCENPEYANHIPEGKTVEGWIEKQPTVDECFFVLKKGMTGYFRTSTVQEIVDKDTFKTCNSIYKIIEREDLDEPEHEIKSVSTEVLEERQRIFNEMASLEDKEGVPLLNKNWLRKHILKH